MNRPFEKSHGLPKGRQHYWNVMREYSERGGFKIGDIAGCTNGVTYKGVKSYIFWLHKAGHLSVIGQKQSSKNRATNIYACAAKARIAPVQRRPEYTGVRGQMSAQIWTAMRCLKSFSINELAIVASTEDMAVNPRVAEKYVRHLRLAGLVMDIVPFRRGSAPGVSGGGANAGIYRLKPSANSGPLPLKLTKNGVFDPNKDRLIPCCEVAA